MTDHLRLLLVEDDEVDAELVRLELERGGFVLDWERVDSEPRLQRALEQQWDVIISDFAMPGFSGLRAFDIYRRAAGDTPFIFVSGALGEDRAVEAMRSGAKDYFLKGNLTRLTAAVRREVTEAKNRREGQRAEEKAQREQRRLALAIEASGAGIFELRLEDEGTVDYSGAWQKLLGYELSALPSRTRALRTWITKNVHGDDLAGAERGLNEFLASGTAGANRYSGEFRLRHNDGHWVDVATSATVFAWGKDGAPLQVVGVVLDLSSRKYLEAQLRQAQKMEAVGQLAGGVAHDFNNLLTAILSLGAFALEAVPAESTANQDISEVLKAAKRAQSLTSKLLAFSRRKSVSPRVLNVNDVVASADRILRRLLGADVELVTEAAPDLWNVKIDHDDLEQVLLNLAVNARDAMPDGGKLTIGTVNVHLASGLSGRITEGALTPGDYVVVSVSDSGSGMSAETQSRIFEPFFTTKEPGRGTGLGLSTCYGIIKQAEGFILVESEVGRGTTFKLYLPRVVAPTERVAPKAEPGNLRGTEVILLVEDTEQVRAVAKRVLVRLGYTVIEATNGVEALARLAASGGKVDLLITDLVMPVMGGKQLAERIRQTHPVLPVLFMSGYDQSAVTSDDMVDSRAPIVQKPFTPDTLGRKVREILDAAAVTVSPS
jgi:hypothetical protein